MQEKETVIFSETKPGAVTNRLRCLYMQADKYGLVVAEYSAPKGYLAALFSRSELERNGIESPYQLTGTMTMLEASWPGSGETRELAVKDALKSWRSWNREQNLAIQKSRSEQQSQSV